jgi:hypothetical protein
MFRQTYESHVVPYLDYRPPGEFNNLTYNEWLMEPPRIYFDSLEFAKVLFRVQDSSALNGYAYGLMAYMNYVNWPGWESLIFSFNSTTGVGKRYEGVLAPIWLAWTTEIVQDYNGTLWRTDIFGNMNPLTVYLNGNNYSITEGAEITNEHFGVPAIRHPIVDVQKNVVAMYGDFQVMHVYAWDTGALLRKIYLSGDPIAVCAGDQDYAYVLCHNNTLDVINIQTGQTLGVSKLERANEEATPLLSWDYRYRRLLIFESTPDAVNGESTARIRGYYPVAQPTALMKPIPLKAPRINRTTPVLSRMVGDVGEALSGGVVVGEITPATTAAATLVSVTETPDENGYISFRMNGTEPGEIEFGVTAEV